MKLFLSTVLLSACLAGVTAAHAESPRLHTRQLLQRIGAGLENSGTPAAIAAHRAAFQELDANADGLLTSRELTSSAPSPEGADPQDELKDSGVDQSELVTPDQYALQLVLSDEAQRFFERLDRDGDGTLAKAEFVAAFSAADQPPAADLYDRSVRPANTNRLTAPQWRAVWIRWAHEAPLEARLIVKQDTYRLPKDWQTEAFRERIRTEEDSENLPLPPSVELVLELYNTGDEPLAIWPGGSIDEPELKIEGPGIVKPDSLRSFSGSSSATSPQPVIRPGKRFTIDIDSLNPGAFSLDNVYWTKAGEYQISATYPVWKNLPPHLPELFGQPAPAGLPIRFQVVAPPCKVRVESAP